MNQQPIEKQSLSSDHKIDVISVFPTIQGEGPYSGKGAVFLRLAGCNLQCPGCDTDYTSKRRSLSLQEVMEVVEDHASKFIDSHITKDWEKLIVITGGEPFRQQITPLLEYLLLAGWSVQVETNGTLTPIEKIPAEVMLVCSPKTPNISPAIAQHGNIYFKYVIKAGNVDASDGLPLQSLDNPIPSGKPVYRPKQGTFRGIYLTPFDEKDPERNRYNNEQVVESCGLGSYTAQVQLHKILGVE